MRIGCLQFAPQVADVDNNLNRADAVLSKADADELDGLDLLVVPELAFSGEHLMPKPPPPTICLATSRPPNSARHDAHHHTKATTSEA